MTVDISFTRASLGTEKERERESEMRKVGVGTRVDSKPKMLMSWQNFATVSLLSFLL